MTLEITENNENEPITDTAAPPLCLVHYFVESAAYPPERNPKPPGIKLTGRVAERSGNVLILEFAPPPESVQAKWQQKRRNERLRARIVSKLFLLLLLIGLLGCFIASRF